MTLQDYIDEIKLELTGGLLELEINDEIIGKVVNKAFREIQRYMDLSKFITVPYASCIDLKDFNSSYIVKVYRTHGYTGDANKDTIGTMADPMYAQQWLVFSNGGELYNLNDYILNFATYNTLLQLRNTASTDMSFQESKQDKKLYINAGYDKPKYVTIEYVPIYSKIEDIEDDYWIDVLSRLSLALTKITLGRIRSRYKSSSSLWTQDGDELLQEGNEEVKELRENLRINRSMVMPVD